MKTSVMMPTIATPSVHRFNQRLVRRRELLKCLLGASLAGIGCKRSPQRYEVYYYYLPY
jgi:hypothetical protein